MESRPTLRPRTGGSVGLSAFPFSCCFFMVFLSPYRSCKFASPSLCIWLFQTLTALPSEVSWGMMMTLHCVLIYNYHIMVWPVYSLLFCPHTFQTCLLAQNIFLASCHWWDRWRIFGYWMYGTTLLYLNLEMNMLSRPCPDWWCYLCSSLSLKDISFCPNKS